MPVLRRADEAEERVRALLSRELLGDFANRTRLTAIIQFPKGDRQVWVMDRESRTRQMLREGDVISAGDIAVTVTEIGTNQATFEAGGSRVKLVTGR
jgi:hypothetical protein